MILHASFSTFISFFQILPHYFSRVPLVLEFVRKIFINYYSYFFGFCEKSLGFEFFLAQLTWKWGEEK
ncbi:hypothetical protein L1987_43001 [Smallanthus sonchifolius]|uniref:Uncharacterized protein n=1 Tax=Smallanthus sonchifolius TaxID=185202 RepID=A0ACB9GLE1_9ASTR|nr:hypothetical protein L1987_43001 [Smallanthus sonchifolius]